MDDTKSGNAESVRGESNNAESSSQTLDDKLATDADWSNVRELVKNQQQEYYELLPEWTKYNKYQHKYLKQNIGFSIYGPPKQSATSNESVEQNVQYKESDNDGNCYVTDMVRYGANAQAVIDNIFDKIYKFGNGSIDADYIYYGIIFNTMIPIKSPSLKKKEICVMTTPVFKIKKLESGSSASTSKMRPVSYKTWYIDINGRVYKSWSDYKNCNKLPPYKMFLPKDGFYQPNKAYVINQNSSIVWLEEVDSPVCKNTETVLRGIDTTANITGIAGLALGIASLFTPAAPITLGAAIATGGSAVWGIGRSSHQLVDRSVHEESINPFADKQVISSWLSITSATLGIAATGGTALLTQAIRNGRTLGTSTRIAFNSLAIGSVGINGVGMMYQAYCIWEDYRREGQVSSMALMNLGTHILFFGNSVINIKLAGTLIESTQGQVLDDYRNAIRSKRLRKQFNRVTRIAAENNSGQMHENAEVIKFINKKYEVWQQNNIQVPKYNIVRFEDGVITIDDEVLLDPMKFVAKLLEAEKCLKKKLSDEDANSPMVCDLRNLLIDLLENFNTENSGRSAPVFNIDDFKDIFNEMKNMRNALDIFRVVFKLATILIKCYQDPKYLEKAVRFLWFYAKQHTQNECSNLTTSIEDPNVQAVLQEFINCMFEHADTVVEPLIPAFACYVSKTKLR